MALLTPIGESPIFDRILEFGKSRGHEIGENGLVLSWMGEGDDVCFEPKSPGRLNIFFSENSYKAKGSPLNSLIVSIDNPKAERAIPFLAVVNSEESYKSAVAKYPDKPIVFIGDYNAPTGIYAGTPTELERILKEVEVFIPESEVATALDLGCVVPSSGVSLEVLWDEIERLLIPDKPKIRIISETTNAIGRMIVFGESAWAEHSLNVSSPTSADLWNKAVLTYDADYYLPVIGEVNLELLREIPRLIQDKPKGVVFGAELNLNSALFDKPQVLFSRELWEQVGGFFEGCPRETEFSPFLVAALRDNAPLLAVPDRLFETKSNPSLTITLFPDLFDLRTLLTAHEALKPVLDIDQLTQINKCFPNLMMPLFWLGLALEERKDFVEAAKVYMESVNYELNWQAMLRLQVVSTILAKEAENQGEKEIAKERYLAAEEFALVAEQLLTEQPEILAPDWPRFPLSLKS